MANPLGTASSHLNRRLLVWTVVFGIFVLCDLALFGWLIFRSLSEREVNRVILEARDEAEELAQQIANGAEARGIDLYTAVSAEAETQTYIDSVLAQRRIVEEVEIRDRDGLVIFRNKKVTDFGEDGAGADQNQALDTPLQIVGVNDETPYDRVEVPVGNLGTFVIGISSQELEARLLVLRSELLRQASIIAGLTVALFMGAYLLFFRFFRRAQLLEEKAEEAERLAYVGTLASGLAHEIRSPLNSLNLNMQMLEEEYEQGLAAGRAGSSGRRLTAITRSEISRLERLVTDFLSYARPRELERENVTALELMQHAAEVLQGKLQASGVRVSIDDDTQGARVSVDREQLNQLLLNLVDNALAAVGEAKAPEIRFQVRRVGEQIALAIRDNGTGIAVEDQEHIFELFYSKRKGGTGLGLAIVDRIARAHEGALRVESAAGRGTTIELLLPEVDGPSRARSLLEETGRFLRPNLAKNS